MHHWLPAPFQVPTVGGGGSGPLPARTGKYPTGPRRPVRPPNGPVCSQPLNFAEPPTGEVRRRPYARSSGSGGTKTGRRPLLGVRRPASSAHRLRRSGQRPCTLRAILAPRDREKVRKRPGGPRRGVITGRRAFRYSTTRRAGTKPNERESGANFSELYTPEVRRMALLPRLSGKFRRAPNRGHTGRHRGARRPYFRVAGERSSLADDFPTLFPDSLSTHSGA